ncbi:MAG: hypothetical protein K2H38_07120 [Muribaculaceae bacterium]|nr:hypothetical protein [Muribaculaceae bacterium]
MNKGRRRLNISLIILSILLAGWAARICRQPSLSYTDIQTTPTISAVPEKDIPDIIIPSVAADMTHDSTDDTAQHTAYKPQDAPPPAATTRVHDADVRFMTGTHPFSAEARKVLSGDLEETDSLSRHKILSYCEHLRTSYTSRDIDFLRQVFSDDALIIVGQMVRTSKSRQPKGSQKVMYAIRSKREYLDRLSKIFNSGKDIDLKFSGFRIRRHPTMEGIYGVTLHQEYSCGTYSDDGWLFLLWDFRDPSMPVIHVRTWQPTATLADGTADLIDMGDFNLE